MKKITFLLFILLSFNSFAVEALFNKANDLYSQENYTAAISIYDSILTLGLESSELYYNLGNCHYKQQNWSNAIWHYEKSLKLHSNKRTFQNLELAKLKIIDKIEAIPELFYKTWWRYFISIFSTKIWQFLTLVSLWTTLIFQLTSQLKESIKGKNLAFISFIVLTLLFITQTSYNNNYIKKEAIIFSSSIVVNSAPSNNSTDLFSLHSGSKVLIIDNIGDWINIRIANGNEGWINQREVKEL
ncbi:tetratricopeptide repeat protein [Flavobacteriales bacterium]|nr:tetratricopeptide repeat protein [Flavobacteriales bacterium]